MQCCIILTVNLLTWRKCHLFFTEKQNHLFPHMTNKVYTVKPTVESPYELFFYCRSSFNSGAFQDFPYIPPGKYIIQLVFPPDINGNSIGSFMLTGRSQWKYRKDKDKYQNIITEVAKECGCPRKLDNLIWCKMPNSEGKN